MKNKAFFALFTLILTLITSLKGQTTWVPEGSSVTYGTPGKGIWHIGANEDEPQATADRLAEPLAELFFKKVHPFLWNKTISEEVMWHISATQDGLNKELKLVNEQSPPSWIWENAPDKPFKIFISLPKSGFGRIRIFQGHQIIASFRCVSSDKIGGLYSQPRVKSYSILQKESVHPSKEFHGLPMKWAMCIDDNRGIYLHSRNISENSHGCIGISVPAVKWLYSKAKVGTIVVVTL